MKIFDELMTRGFIADTTHEAELIDKLNNEKLNFYWGIDATADSLTAGHFLNLIAIKRLQNAGHRPVILVGGGTTLIGDPSGRNDMRKMMTRERINQNAECIKKQLSKIIDFSDGKAIMVNNADWLTKLNYIDFLRDYAPHFSINRMVQMESYKTRMKDGLTLLEFNYMPMQAYDFLHLYREENCTLQVGGSDQWSNIIGGVELIRKLEKGEAYGLTFSLLTTSNGVKMGKTAEGAVWLDPEKTTPYEFFQYWRNVEDVMVKTYLLRLTLLDLNKIDEITNVEGSEINKAKEVLAYEITSMIHGKEEADKALEASKALFSSGSNLDNAPTTVIDKSDLGIEWLELLVRSELVSTKSEARRLIKQNGLSLNGEKIKDPYLKVSMDDFKDSYAMVKKGKKVFHKFEIG